MTSPLIALDLFSGRGGASAAWSDLGYTVITVDNNPSFFPSVVADISSWRYSGLPVRLLWASFPCTEFARESMPWCRTGVSPDLSLYYAARRIRDEVCPTWWVFENVRGAIPYIQESVKPVRFGGFYLWSNLPLHRFTVSYRPKSSYSSTREDLRAVVPPKISRIVGQMARDLAFLPGI